MSSPVVRLIGAKIQRFKLAEREGFEPSIPFWSMHAFQACAFNHSAISPPGAGNFGHAPDGKQSFSGQRVACRRRGDESLIEFAICDLRFTIPSPMPERLVNQTS